MGKKKEIKGQTMIYKTLHRILKIEHHEPHYSSVLEAQTVLASDTVMEIVLDTSRCIWLQIT
jgi:hypothetical protein